MKVAAFALTEKAKVTVNANIIVLLIILFILVFMRIGFLVLVTCNCSQTARNQEPSSRGASKSGLTSADSGLQLDLEIA